jgi:hypothetical protein
MPSTFTSNTGIELPADGEQSGLWGQTVNLNMEILDRALNGSVDVSLSGTTHTLTTSDGVLSDGQYGVIVFGGSPSGTNTVTIAPDTAQKTYIVRNTTAQSVVLTQGSGGDVTIPAGNTRIVYTTGSGAGSAVVNITDLVALGAAARSLTLTAGDGLTGGGDLTANRTFTLGTPSAVTATSINSVPGNSHTHEIDGTIARSARTITAGDGLTGGGDLTADRTLTMGTPSALTATSTNAATTTSHTHSIDSTIARSAVTITAGDGLTGGGNLTADRTLTMGTPSALTATSTNAATTTSHTHSIDSTIARSAVTITAGDGLTGGGDLTANRTLDVDSTVVRTSRTITAGDGLTGGGNLTANRTLDVDSTVVRTSRTITAGDGLTGGGNLTANRTITMGTPGSITATSTNSASGSSHTHSISAGTIRTLIADSSPGQVGTYAFLMRNGSSLVAGDTIPGSALFDAGIHVSINDSGFSSDDTTNANLTARQGTSRSGTWVAMGRSNGQSGTVLMRTTLFLRIA